MLRRRQVIQPSARAPKTSNTPVYTARIKLLLNEPAIADRLEAMGYEAVGSMDESDFAQLDAATFIDDLTAATYAYRDYLREHPEEIEDVNVIRGELVPALTQECRADPTPTVCAASRWRRQTASCRRAATPTPSCRLRSEPLAMSRCPRSREQMDPERVRAAILGHARQNDRTGNTHDR
jgi:hypothetical protein